MCWRYNVGKPYPILPTPLQGKKNQIAVAVWNNTRATTWFLFTQNQRYFRSGKKQRPINTSRLCSCCWQLQLHLKKRASHLTNIFTYCSWCEHSSSRKHRKVKKVVFLIVFVQKNSCLKIKTIFQVNFLEKPLRKPVERTHVRSLQPSVLFLVLPFNFPEIPQARFQTSKF